MNYELLVDLHRANPRQGPGSDSQTKQAIKLADLSDSSKTLQIADIGCGAGASALILAESLNAKIIAVDLFSEFLNILSKCRK